MKVSEFLNIATPVAKVSKDSAVMTVNGKAVNIFYRSEEKKQLLFTTGRFPELVREMVYTLNRYRMMYSDFKDYNVVVEKDGIEEDAVKIKIK